MSNLFNIFSTREIALFIWILVLVICASIIKDVRHSALGVIKAFFDKRLVVGYITLFLYIILSIGFLWYIGFWNCSLLKDTIFWSLFSGINFFLNANKFEEDNYFSKLIKDQIKLIVIWEYLFNFYTFSLSWELFLIPVVGWFTIVQVYAEHFSEKEANYIKVARFYRNILMVLGLIFIIYVGYKTFTGHQLLLTWHNLKSFLLPVILVILTFPYFYGLTLYMNYENLITIVKHIRRNEDPAISKGIIRATFKYANIRLNRVKRVLKHHVKFQSSKETPSEFVKRILKKPQYVISDKAKLTAFNDIKKIMTEISNMGIGELDEWHESIIDENVYSSMTGYYNFGTDDITIIPNTIAVYLTGQETYITQLEVILNIGSLQDKQQAVKKFNEILQGIFDCLSTRIPADLKESINNCENYNKEYDTHIISFLYEKMEMIDSCTLSIITKTN